MGIEEELESYFLVKDYRWRIDGVLRFPNAEDIRLTIDEAKRRLYDEEPETQLEVGRLIIRKRSQDLYDIFVMIGEEDGST